jgi:RimJ/RimL family protein N-acetyltransferase
VHVHLTTERLVLRRFTPDDVDLLMELYNDPDVMRYINDGAPVARVEIVEEDIPAFLAYYERGDAYGFWAVEESATGRFVGWFHFRPGAGAGPLEPELGYRLHRWAWGTGYATEGSQALIDHGFSALGVEQVNAETMVVHAASRRVMEKVGMRVVRQFHADWPVRIPGDELGDVEYAITRDEWEAARR